MFLEVILSITTIIVFSLFALKPTLLTIIALVKEVRGKEALVRSLDTKISNLEKAVEIYSEEQASLPVIQNAVPDSPSPDTLAEQIEGLVSKNAVSILGISVGEVVIVGEESVKKKSTETKNLPLGASEMSVSISITGSYPNLNSMIKDVENLKLPVKIDILGINASNTKENQTIVAVISGRVPYLKDEK